MYEGGGYGCEGVGNNSFNIGVWFKCWYVYYFDL